jgi:hypothetical protein
MPITDLIALLANVALTLTFVIGLVFGVQQLRAVERDRRERLTIDMLRAFQTREFAEFVNFFLRGRFPEHQGDLEALPERERIMYIQFSQQMESLGILVAENVVDLDLVDKTLGDFVVTTWKKYKVRFEESRKNDPYLGEYFQWLAERMAEYSKELPRQPFYTNRQDVRTLSRRGRRKKRS